MKQQSTIQAHIKYERSQCTLVAKLPRLLLLGWGSNNPENANLRQSADLNSFFNRTFFVSCNRLTALSKTEYNDAGVPGNTKNALLEVLIGCCRASGPPLGVQVFVCARLFSSEHQRVYAMSSLLQQCLDYGRWKQLIINHRPFGCIVLTTRPGRL